MTTQDITTVMTPRLLLRRVRERDRPAIRQMDTNPAIMGVDGIRSAAESDRFVSNQIAHWERHGFGIWVAFDRATMICAGRGGLRHITLDGEQVVQVGYGFFPGFWGRGLATEVAIASTRVGFEVLGLARLVAIVMPDNTPSRRVLEKVGFTHVSDTLYDGSRHLLYESRRPPSDPVISAAPAGG